MRVTQNMKTLSLIYDLRQNSEKIVKYQNQISTAKRIQRPSDDPIGTSKVMYLKELAMQNKRYQKNIQDAKMWFVATEVALNGAAEVLSQVNITALKGADDTLTIDERRILADQVQQMLDQMVDISNRKHGTRYLFGGTVLSASPYSLSNEISEERFQSEFDQEVELANVQISESSVVVTSVDGSVTFTEGVDYSIDYELGTIEVLSTGSMADSTEYAISYETQQNCVPVENSDGNEGSVFREISQGEVVQINTTGTEAFTEDVDVFSALRQLKNALYRNDTEAIGDLVGLVQDAADQIAIAQSEVGLRYQVVESTLKELESVYTQIEMQRSKIEDTDFAETFVKLETQNTTYNAALKTGAKIITPSLVEYLG